MQIFTIHTFDLVRYRGAYFGELGLMRTLEFNSNLALELAVFSGWASAKFNEVYVGLHRNAFNVVEGELSLLYYPQKYLYFKPHLRISYIVNEILHEYIVDSSPISFGVSIGTEF